MTAASHSASLASNRAIPQRIAEPLRQVAGMHRLVRLGAALLRTAALVLAVWLAVILTLGTARLPLALRLALALAAWGSVAWGLARYIFPALKRHPLSDAARQIEATHPDVQERITSAVELAQNPEDPYRGSPLLVADLTRQAEAHAQAVDPQSVVSTRALVRWLLLCLPIALAWLIAAGVGWPTVSRGLQHTLLPWQTPAAGPSVTIAVTPGDASIAQGDALTITAEVPDPLATHERIEHATLSARYPTGQAVTTELDRIGPRRFQIQFDNLQQPFTYSVSAGGAVSPTYRIAILPRPAVAGFDVQYTYPAYTRLPARTDLHTDGGIDAVVGTRVHLIIHATAPLLAKSRLLFAEGTANQAIVPLEHGTADNYAAELTLLHSGQYRLELASLAGGRELANADRDLHAVLARPDLPPVIAITSPQANLRIRPDDAVDVKFTARDDFGIAALAALIQVDERSPETVAIPFAALNPAKVDGVWRISVPACLAAAGANALDAKRITYQLQATDNCVPTPHLAVSGRQTLELDRTAQTIATRQVQEKAKDLAEALRNAQDQLAQARRQIAALQARAANPLSAADKDQTQQTKEQLVATAQALSDAAREAQQTPQRDLADRAEDVARHPIPNAASAVAEAQLAGDQPATRARDLATAQEQIAAAQKQLAALASELDKKQEDQAVANRLQTLADKQQPLARDLQTADPKEREKLLSEQKDLQKQLEQIIRENPELQKPAAAQAEPKVQSLAEKVDALRKEQSQLEEQVRRRDEAAHLPQKLRDLTRQDDKLSKDINDFAGQHGQDLKNAAAQEPDKSQLDAATRNLEAGKLQTAAQQEKAAAAAMDEAANRMDQAARRAAASAQRDHDASTKTQDAATEAAKIASQVQQLAKDIQAAKDQGQPAVRPGDAPNQKARDIAKEAERLAGEIAAQNPAEKAAMDQARKTADAAQQAANDGRAEAAQQQLANAAQQLSNATRAAAQQAAASAANDKALQDAARQAHDLAQRKQAIADEADQALKTTQDAASHEDPAALAQQQRALAGKIDQARQEADKVQQDTAAAAPATAQRARDAAQALGAAAQSQQQAASATSGSQTSQADTTQQESRQQLAHASELLHGQPTAAQPANAGSGTPTNQPNAGQANGSPSGPPSAMSRAAEAVQQAREAQGQAAQGDAPAAARAAEQLAKAARYYKQAEQEPAPGSANPNAATPDQVAQAQPGQGSATPGRTAPTQSAPGQPGGAQTNGTAPAAGGSQSGAPTPGGQAQANTPGQGQPTAAGSTQGGTQGGQTPGGSNTPASGQNPSGTNAGAAASGGAGSGPAGRAGGGAGTTIQPSPTVDSRPQAVKDVGISPDDWAKLPPLMQQQLLNAAQQKGPPAYQDMIKSYYQRIARMTAESANDNKP